MSPPSDVSDRNRTNPVASATSTTDGACADPAVALLAAFGVHERIEAVLGGAANPCGT
jgi:hypothetical protein